MPGVRLGGVSSRIDAGGLPERQGQLPLQLLFWPISQRPQPSGDFWIVMHDLTIDQIAWSAALADPTAHSDVAHDGFKLDRNLQTDYSFRVYVVPP